MPGVHLPARHLPSNESITYPCNNSAGPTARYDGSMTPLERAEWDRLHRALTDGPGRRMDADTLAGRPHTRADVEQAERYRRAMAALERRHA